MPSKDKILFLCTGNSCRSQMAESLLNDKWNQQFVAFSAGTAPKQIDRRAVEAMKEIGLDISANRSQSISDHADVLFDLVITVCGHADETCPVFPSVTKVIHVGFDDPPVLAQNAASEEAALAFYRRVRDEIKAFISDFPKFYTVNKTGRN